MLSSCWGITSASLRDWRLTQGTGYRPLSLFGGYQSGCEEIVESSPAQPLMRDSED